MTHQPHCLCMNVAVLDVSAKLGHPHKRGSLEHIKIQGHGGRKERIQRLTVHCPQAASVPSTGRSGRQRSTPNSVRLLQQPVSTILGSPSCPLNGQHWLHKSWRKEKEDLSNPVHFCPWALQSWEKGTSFYGFRRGSCPPWWWGGTAFYMLISWVVTVLPHYLLPLQKMHIF